MYCGLVKLELGSLSHAHFTGYNGTTIYCGGHCTYIYTEQLGISKVASYRIAGNVRGNYILRFSAKSVVCGFNVCSLVTTRVNGRNIDYTCNNRAIDTLQIILSVVLAYHSKYSTVHHF